jgi:hypothetical protein
MKKINLLRIGSYGLVLILLICGIASGASSTVAATTTSASSSSSATTASQDAASLVYVSGVTYSPQVFYPGEQGTITVHLTNSGTTSIGLSQPDLIDTSVEVVNKNSFQTLSYIGPGATMDISFIIKATAPDGMYFPLFSIGTVSASAIHYPIKLQIDSTDLRASISDKPDSFAVSRTDTVNLSLVNPRNGNLDNVLVTTSGPGVDVSPSESFLTTINPGTSVDFPFKVTPGQQGDLTFHIEYQNGDNKHSTDVVLPLNIGEDKTGANPVVNNVALTPQGSSYQLSGDVNNAGITDAKSMVLTVASPAQSMEPYAEYAIGTLASDDFSSFQLTFTSKDLSNVPLQIQWKDADGNTFSTIKNLDLRAVAGSSSLRAGSSTGSGGAGTAGGATTGTAAAGGNAARGGGGGFALFGGRGGGGLSSFYPVIAGAIVVIAGIVLYTKRKWIAGKLKKQ